MKSILKSVIIAIMSMSLAACGLWKNRTEDRIAISGNIELTQVDIAFKIPGKITVLPIVEGALVEKGALLARLDALQTERQLQRDQASLRSAESLMGQQQIAIQFQRESLEADIAARKAAVNQAEARLQELLAGSRKQEIAQTQAAVHATRQEFTLAQKDWERAQSLHKTDDISTQQFDQFRTRFESSAALLKQNEERLALVLEGPRKEQIDGARAQLEQTKAMVKLAEAARLEIKRKEAELTTRRAEIDRASAQVGIVDAQLQDAVVTSPVNGVILVKSSEIGEVVGAGTTLATIGEIDRPWFRGYIAEKDLGRVNLGMKARVTTDSFPNKEYWGRVSFIASEAEFTPKQIQTQEERVKLVYRVKIEIENSHHELKLNMPVDAEILLQ